MEKVKFNWAHAICTAFALIYSYFVFMGELFITNGEYGKSFIIAIITFVLLVGLTILMQKEKGSTGIIKIAKVKEIIFGVLFLGVAIWSIIPFAHFKAIYDNKDIIENKFSSIIEQDKGLFPYYEQYVLNREDMYENILEEACSGKNSRPSEYYQFVKQPSQGKTDEERIKNLKRSMHNSLMPANYDILKSRANNWLKEASKVSIWNIFLVDNINKVNSNVTQWNTTLNEWSKKIQQPGDTAKSFSYNVASQDFSSLYKTKEAPSPIMLLAAIMCYIAMMLPYIIAHRIDKDTYITKKII